MMKAFCSLLVLLLLAAPIAVAADDYHPKPAVPGAVWTTFYPYPDRMAGIRKLLNLPDNIEPLNIIPIGYPAEKKGPESRFNPAKIHYDRW